MKQPTPTRKTPQAFRLRLWLALMLFVAAVTGLSLYFAQRTLSGAAERSSQQQFQAEMARRAAAQEVRHAALAERCRSLVRRPRIHAALEDNALDLLYPSANDELHDLLVAETPENATPYALHANFYRFLDPSGSVIKAPEGVDAGALSSGEEESLGLGAAPEQMQLGYLARVTGESGVIIDEVVSMPIYSTETGETIAALVVGFRPAEAKPGETAPGMLSGLWLQGRLHLEGISPDSGHTLGQEIARAVADPTRAGGCCEVTIREQKYLLFQKLLNPGSRFPAAWEVCFFPLSETEARQRQARWRILSAGVAVLLAGLAGSQVLSTRLAAPVEELAVTSAEHAEQRDRAQEALKQTSEELQRSARFSADASHQLKTPVTVLRAGLEEMLARSAHSDGEREEISALIHQTYRLGTIIEDLLLLSRMEAGRLRLDLQPLDVGEEIARWLDDLSALPDELELHVENELPPGVQILGERRYTGLILQNLLENARKYNRLGGTLRIAGQVEGEMLVLSVANSGVAIAPAAQEHIFERFHRGVMGENVPGYGLGLNLARELARLHGGELRLAQSASDWTVFEVRFRLARSPARTYESA